MNWRLAKALIKLKEQIDASHPNRSRVSDGSIGDSSHQARGSKSDHNVNAQGVVTAIDITHDPAHGVDGTILSRELAKDKRTKYVIFNHQIYRTYKPQLEWATYTGANAHEHHVHISVLAAGCDDVSPWLNLEAEKPSVTRSTLRRGNTGTAVQDLQRALGITVDGNFGRDSEHAVREFQAHNNLTIDGIAGPKVNALLFK